MNQYQIQRVGKKTLSTELRHRVYVQPVTLTADGQGGFSKSWADSYPTWASVDPLKAEQVDEYRSIGVDATHRLKIRGPHTIAEDDRIRFGARTFEILTGEDLQERGILRMLICKERR